MKLKVGKRYSVRTAQDTVFLAFTAKLTAVKYLKNPDEDTRLFFDNGVELAIFNEPENYMWRVK